MLTLQHILPRHIIPTGIREGHLKKSYYFLFIRLLCICCHRYSFGTDRYLFLTWKRLIIHAIRFDRQDQRGRRSTRVSTSAELLWEAGEGLYSSEMGWRHGRQSGERLHAKKSSLFLWWGPREQHGWVSGTTDPSWNSFSDLRTDGDGRDLEKNPQLMKNF